KMLFTVIIPAYNAEKFIARSVNSVLKQDYPYCNYEIIIVDDCSPDNLQKKLSELCAENHDANIRVIRHTENKKQGGARNTAIRESRGEWIFFLDADDYWIRTDVFKVFESLILKYPESSIIESATHRDVGGYNLIVEHSTPQLNANLYSGADYFSDSGAYTGYIWTAAYKRDYICNFQFREKVFFEDGDWKLIVFINCPKIVSIDFPFYAYVANPVSTIRGRNIEVFRANIEVNRIILNVFLGLSKGKLRDAGLNRVKRNVKSWFKVSKEYSFRGSYKALNHASSTELFNLSNYTLTGMEKIALLSLKHCTLLTLLSIRAGIYTRRFYRKIYGKRLN
nr:glycosyltransferase [Muribaculaceae bacterium]